MDVPHAGSPVRRRSAEIWGLRSTSSARLSNLSSAFWVGLIPGSVLFMAMQLIGYAGSEMIGADSHAYWRAARFPDTWYTSLPGHRDAFLYSPAFAQLLSPLGHLEWPTFQVLWVIGQAAVLAWLLAPCGWKHGLTLAPFFIPDMLLGNVYLFFAGALVISLGRFPGAAALPVLTKISPGAMTGLWFLVRKEWRALCWSLAATALIIGGSVALDPRAWASWAHFLGQSAGSGGSPLIARLLLAAAVTVVAARTSRAWLMAPALILASPVLGGWVAFAVLAAVPRLLTVERAEVGGRPQPTDAARGTSAGLQSAQPEDRPAVRARCLKVTMAPDPRFVRGGSAAHGATSALIHGWVGGYSGMVCLIRLSRR